MTYDKIPPEIMCWLGQWPLSWAGTWATTRYPETAVAYVPKASLQRMEQAAQLGLDMARANGLTKTAEKIRKEMDRACATGDVAAMMAAHEALKGYDDND